jgi:hypothetical protein
MSTLQERNAKASASRLATRLANELSVNLSSVAGSGTGGRITEADVRAAAELATTSLSAAEHDTGPYVTPAVRKLAASGGIELSTLTGTGVGGRISAKDVRAAIERARPRLASVLAIARPTRAVEMGSEFDSVKVKVDPYARNPLLDDARQSSAFAYAEAAKDGPAPTLFNSGDLPIYLASGADPTLLMRLPWWVRHPAASASAAGLAGALERFGGGRDEDWVDAQITYGGDSDNRAYRDRVYNWLIGNTPEAIARREKRQLEDYVAHMAGKPVSEESSALYDGIFGEDDRRKAAAAKHKRDVKAAQDEHEKRMRDLAAERHGRR